MLPLLVYLCGLKIWFEKNMEQQKVITWSYTSESQFQIKTNWQLPITSLTTCNDLILKTITLLDNFIKSVLEIFFLEQEYGKWLDTRKDMLPLALVLYIFFLWQKDDNRLDTGNLMVQSSRTLSNWSSTFSFLDRKKGKARETKFGIRSVNEKKSVWLGRSFFPTKRNFHRRRRITTLVNHHCSLVPVTQASQWPPLQ